MHSLYSILIGMSRQIPIDPSELAWNAFDGDAARAHRGELIVKTIIGTTQEAMLRWVRVHNTILRHRELRRQLQAGEGNAASLVWQIAEIEAELDFEDTQLAAKANELFARPEHHRVKVGHEMYRCMTRVHILRAVFGVPSADRRVQECVHSILKLVPTTVHGTEVGMTWPLVIVGCEALPADQPMMLAMIKRTQYKVGEGGCAALTARTRRPHATLKRLCAPRGNAASRGTSPCSRSAAQ